MSTQNDSYKNTTQQEVRATLKKIIEARKKEIKTLNESISKISTTINTNIL